MKRIFSYILTCALCIGMLASCGTPNTQSGSAITKENSGKKTDILLWMPPFGTEDALDKEFWTNALTPWASENNVNLTIEITPWGGYEEKYLTGFSSGDGPDVGYMYLEMFNDFIEMGTLADINTYFTQKEKDNYLYWEKGFMKNGQYSLPFIVGNARIPYFNMDILNQVGVNEPPKTWQELIDVAVKVKEMLPDVIPFAQEWADPAIGALNNVFYPYLWQAGGDIYNADGTAVALSDNTAALEAAQFLHDLRFKYGVITEESLALSGNAVRDQFIAGRVAIASMDAKSSTLIDKANINWDFIPSFEGKTKATWVASDALIMNNASDNKELAASLMKFMTSAPVMSEFHKNIGAFPPITKDEDYNDNPRFKDMYENESEYFHTLPVANGAFKVMDTLYKNLQLMMLGDLTPEQVIKQTVDYSNSIK